jgi:hypothetical protein
LNVCFCADVIVVEAADVSTTARVFYPEVVDLVITGPGAVTTGGGVIGGGFGVAGALEGMAIAAILNALTTRTKVHTFIQLGTHQGEIFLHYGGLEPASLRIALSPVFAHLRRFDPNWIDSRLQRLQGLRGQEMLADEQFELLRSRLLFKPSLTGLEKPEGREVVKCGSCGTSVFATAHVCDVCGRPIMAATVHCSNNAGRAASQPTNAALAPVRFQVIVEKVSPSHREALSQIILKENQGLEEAALRAACEDAMIVVGSDLSLEQANALMLRLHDEGFSPRKEREAEH